MVRLSGRALVGALALATTATAQQGPPAGFSIPSFGSGSNPFSGFQTRTAGAASATSTSSSGTSGGSSPVSSVCVDSSNLCAGINVPSSGSDQDTFFQIKATTTGGYAGLGVGSQMAGSLIFVVYKNSAGDNITLSPRLGKGEIEPLYSDSIKAELLPGSGIINNQFVANIKCSNCRTWDGGSLDVSSTNQAMIWSIGPGSSVMSDQPDAQIQQHSSNGFLSLNVKEATGGSGDNPFVNATPSNGNSGGHAGGSFSFSNSYLIAHAAVMAVTWVIMFPLGAAVIRIFANVIPNAVLVHQCLQIFNFILAVIGLALGSYYSHLTRSHFKSFHQVFGVVLVSLLLVQAALGQLHHMRYQKVQKRTVSTHLHLWLGRIVILLAIINGGIGLGLDKYIHPSKGQIAAYAVVSALVFVAYASFYFLGVGRRRQ